MSALLTEIPHTLRFGGAALRYLVLTAHSELPWSARRRMAAAMTQALHDADVPRAHARADAEGLTVTITLPADETAAEELVTALTRWRELLSHVVLPEPLPPTSIVELITALTFDAGAADFDDSALYAALTSLEFTVVAGGATHDDDLGMFRARAASAVTCPPPKTARPPLPAPVPPTGRRWAQAPVAHSWVRWYRMLPPPTNDTEQLARSLVNIAFGGIQRSPFQGLVRRRRGLSYAPQSSLARLDGCHALVVDVPTTPGREEECDAIIGAALAEFAAEPLNRRTLYEAAAYLRGRTVVDRDSLQGATEERAAVLSGTLAEPFDTDLTPDELCSLAGLERAAHLAATYYQPVGFDVLVVSPGRPTAGLKRKWITL